MKGRPDFSKMTPDEMAALYDSMARANEGLSREIEAKDEEIKRLKAENEKLIAAIARIAADLGDERIIVERYGVERFFRRGDSPKGKAPASPSGAKGRPGRPVGSRQFADVDFERLSEGQEPVVVDPLEGLTEEERSRYIEIPGREGWLLETVRARVVARKVVYKKYKSPGGEIICGESAAPVPNTAVGASLAADLQLSKCRLGVPSYRYIKWLAMEGLPVSEQTLSGWMLKIAAAERPLFEAIRSSVPSLGIECLHLDETHIDVQKAPAPGESGMGAGKKAARQGYAWLASGSSERGAVRLFSFSQSREGAEADALVGGYDGLIVTDAYAGYDHLEGRLPRACCLAHARRKVSDIAKTEEGARRYPRMADALRRYDAVFEKERELVKGRGLTDPRDVLAARQAPEYVAAVSDLIASLRAISSAEAAGSPAKRAADYFLSREESMTLFMRDGRATLDNNEAERLAKSMALARRNFLMVSSKKGGEAVCVAMTLIETAVANGVEPLGYLNWVLSNRRDMERRPEHYLPWSENVPDEIMI